MNTLSKKIIGNALAFFFALFVMLNLSVQKARAQYGTASYQTFYDDLAPYGTWMNDPQYGYVWAPNAGSGFRPYYTNGYWVMTEYGNMWMSDYPWGWAPFHYGRWAYSDYYGWIWIPGDEWGPAWVTWRQGGGYYGWAPMGPGISISMSFGSGYYPDPYWTFIPCNYIYSRSFHRYYAPRRTRTVIRNTTIINNTYVDNRSRRTYVTGPRRSDVERVTGRSVQTYQVNPGRSSGRASVSGRTVNVYRPEVRNAGPGRGGAKAAPRTVRTMERPLKPASGTREQNVQNRQNTNPRSVKPATNSRVQPRENAVRQERPQVTPQKQAVPERREIQDRPHPNAAPVRQRTAPKNADLNRDQNQNKTAPARSRQQQPRSAPSRQESDRTASPQVRQVAPGTASPRPAANSRSTERPSTERSSRGHR